MAERSGAAILRGALVAATLASIGYQVVAILAAHRWRRHAPSLETETEQPGDEAAETSSARPRPAARVPPPSPRRPVPELLPVSILKPVRGLEPHAERSFPSFCVQDYPEYELLFGVAAPADPAADLVRALAKRCPAGHSQTVPTASYLDH